MYCCQGLKATESWAALAFESCKNYELLHEIQVNAFQILLPSHMCNADKNVSESFRIKRLCRGKMNSGMWGKKSRAHRQTFFWIIIKFKERKVNAF